jgi:hypothetical protein
VIARGYRLTEHTAAGRIAFLMSGSMTSRYQRDSDVTSQVDNRGCCSGDCYIWERTNEHKRNDRLDSR